MHSPNNLTAESSWRYAGWRVTLSAAIASAAGFASILIYSFSIFLKPLSAEFGWTRGVVAGAFACASFTLGICSPGLGYLLDRFGPRRVILPCVAIFGVAFASLALLTNSKAQLFATFVLIGAVGNATAQMGYARPISTWFIKHRGIALAMLMAGSSVGMIVVPFATANLVHRYGWRITYLILGCVPLAVAMPLVALFVREKDEHRTHTAPASASGVDQSKAIRSRAFWILAATLFLAAMSTTGTVTHLAALLTDRGISAQSATIAVAALGASGVVGRFLTGWLLDRCFGPRVAMVLLFMTAGGLLLLSATQSAASGILAAVLVGFSAGSESDVTPYVLARYFGIRRLATLYGYTWTAYAVAAALGSILLGRSFDSSGSYTSILIRLAACTFVGGVLMLGMPRYPAAESLAEGGDVDASGAATVPAAAS